MNNHLDNLAQSLQEILSNKIAKSVQHVGELTVTVKKSDWLQIAKTLRDDSKLAFDTLIDVCGLDYLNYGEGAWEGARFAAVYHLLSVKNNQRLRVKVFADNDDLPVIDSVIDIWPVANWYEREAFDLYGIVFVGHPDLRRLLTDYGFIGNPFRKDFPLSGNVEMRYDPDQQRVIYQPVTIEPRELTPRIIREENYGDSA